MDNVVMLPSRKMFATLPSRQRFAIAAVVALIWSIGVAGLYYIALQRAIGHSQKEAEVITRLVGAHFDRTAEHVAEFTAALSKRIAGARDEGEIFRLIKEVPPPRGIILVTFVDSAGVARVSSLEFPLRERVDLSDRPHIKVHIEGRVQGLYVSEPVLGRISNRWTVQFTVPVSNGQGSLMGVLVSSFELEEFTRLYRPIANGFDSNMAVIGRDGGVRLFEGDDFAASSQTLRAELASLAQEAGRERSFELGPITGKKSQVGFLTFSRLVPLAVISWQTMSEVRSQMPSSWTFVIFWLSVTVAIISVALLLDRHLKLVSAAAESESLRRMGEVAGGLVQLPDVFLVRLRQGEIKGLGRNPPSPLVAALRANLRDIEQPRRVDQGVSRLRHLHEGNEYEFSVARLPENSSDQEKTLVILETSRTRRQEAALVRLSRLSSLGEMAAGVAHELSQPLNVIRMAVFNIKDALSQKSPAHEIEPRLSNVEAQVDRTAAILRKMREYAAPFSQNASSSCQLSTVIDAFVQRRRKKLKSNSIDLQVALRADAKVAVSEIAIEQVLASLIDNAQDAFLEAGSIATGRRYIDIVADRGADGSTASITVSNNGPEIPAEIRDRIFEPFFSTKQKNRAAGLGLFTAYTILQEVGGTIGLVSGEKLTSFSIRLPVVA